MKLRILLLSLGLLLGAGLFVSCDEDECFDQQYKNIQQQKALPGSTPSYSGLSVDC